MGILSRSKKPEAAVPTILPDPSRSATPSQLSPGIKKSSGSKWKKSKRQPEPKPELNLTLALPSADNFRTSLIMPNLSARFSMLREQDDPNSLLGKASDDSVLQPRRRSRMVDFGFVSRAALGDIAEVSSVRSSARPPFAGEDRQDSFHSEEGYDSDPNGGSVMSRARPGEGNSLFGGRQKVYIIPKSGVNSARGKAVYEDDIKMSAFQKHKLKEREEAAARMADEARQFDFGLDDADNEDYSSTQHDSHQDLSHSPSLSSYDKKRSTNSSSVPSEARTSTAATSVASQTHSGSTVQNPGTGTMQSRPSLERSNTKGKRLYEPGLDQHIHEQQSSAMSRLNSIQRQKSHMTNGRASPYLHQTKSVNNLHDTPAQRSVYALGRQSPAFDRRPTPLTNLDTIRRQGSNGGSPVTSGPVSPLSPTGAEFEGDAVLVQALEPGDRGKATAMGAFNKPKQAFDEKQYLERQMQLQRSTSSAAIRREASAPSGFQQRIEKFENISRDRSDSAASNGSASMTSSKNRDSEKSFEGSAAKNPNRRVTSTQLLQFSPQMNAHQTFFGNIAASDSEDEEDEQRVRDHFANFAEQSHGNAYGKWQPSILPSVSEHPALRSRNAALLEVAEEDEQTPTAVTQPEPISSQRLAEIAMPSKIASDHDSPTLPDAGNLNGLVSHLRSRSNASSMYPGDELPVAGDVPEMPANARHIHAYGANNPLLRNFSQEITSASTHVSNPWDLDDATNDYLNGRLSATRSVSPLEPNSRLPVRSGTQRDLQGQSQLSQISAVSGESESTWQKELRQQNSHHQRDTSSATQQERAAFDNELAARRAAIQDNIKSIVETERSQSPAPLPSGPLKALGILRTKTSRDSMDTRRDVSSSSKPFKLFGASGSNSPSTNSPTSVAQERAGQSFDASRSRGNSTSRPALPSQPRVLHSENESRRDWETRDARTHGRSPTQSSGGQDARSRSTSVATTGRSRSRTGPYRDDLEKAMMEGTASSAAGLPDLTHFVPKELTPRPSPDVSQSSFDTGRQRSGSRTGYFDPKTPPAPPAMPRNLSNGALPQTLSSAVYTPNGVSARPSPVPSPFMQQTATPPLSSTSTTFNDFAATNGSRPLRKKTISKSDISEPTLISTTSDIDTIDLPPGASLKNGMNEAPPVPPINPKRKTRKLFGKSIDTDESMLETRNGRSKTPDPWAAFDANTGPMVETRHHVLTPQLRGYDSSPALTQYGFEGGPVRSTPDLRQEQTASGVVHGGMF